jgi:hypothetical protein
MYTEFWWGKRVKNLHLEDGEGGGRIKLIYGVD